MLKHVSKLYAKVEFILELNTWEELTWEKLIVL